MSLGDTLLPVIVFLLLIGVVIGSCSNFCIIYENLVLNTPCFASLLFLVGVNNKCCASPIFGVAIEFWLLGVATLVIVGVAVTDACEYDGARFRSMTDNFEFDLERIPCPCGKNCES